MSRHTTVFELKEKNTGEIRPIVLGVYALLKEKGYNPAAQIAGYVLSEDPAYITAHGKARTLMSRLSRDELLEDIVKYCLCDAGDKK